MAKKEDNATYADSSKYYDSIGFLCGLEIHQRLATRNKLYCSCIANLLQADPIVSSIYRRQRAVAGESGKIDMSAKFEEAKDKAFEYNVYKNTSCLVDIDEEPPHELNAEALEVALAIASSLNMKFMDELEPMRKEVVDGSNPAAFQRTTIIGMDGNIKIGDYSIDIPAISLEEESAGIASNNGNIAVYDTNRIGIPLIEIDTSPYIKTPKQAKEIALRIGTLLRISGMVQRGIGTIRQDVNVSIKGGARTEIKGLQEVDMLDTFVKNEVIRQLGLIKIRDTLLDRNASIGQAVELTDLFRGTSVKVINKSSKNGASVFGFRLIGFNGILGNEINPNRRLGSEISDYAKMAGVKGIIHSDENLEQYGFTISEIEGIKNRLSVDSGDAFILVAGDQYTSKKAVRLAIERAEYAMVGVPKETRSVLDADLGTTRFMRPLPGGSRMYPETDAKPLLLAKAAIDRAVASAPDIEKEILALKEDLDDDALVKQMLLSPRLIVYKKIASKVKVDRKFIANMLLQKFTEMKRQGIDADSIDAGLIESAFIQFADGRLTKQGVEEAIRRLALNGGTVDEIIKANKLERISGKALASLIDKIAAGENLEKAQLIKKIMNEYRLNIDGTELNGLLGR